MTESPCEGALLDALRGEYEKACDEARIPSAGLVWWRASIRARAEAARTAEQPMSVTHVVAGAVLAAAAGALGASAWHEMPAWPQASPLLVFVVAAAAVCCVAAPLALVLALVRRRGATESANKP